MRRWMAAPAVFAAAAALALLADAPTARGQDNKPVEEKFTTADGVTLQGLFHKSPQPKSGNPVVILLYPPGPANTMLKPGDWDGLTALLTKEGFNVFRFDWRGHGRSTDITDTDLFWNNPITGPWNQKCVPGYNAFKRTGPDRISVKKDVRSSYFPVYVNDLAAARVHLDAKNDPAGGSQVNTSSVYLIGAGDAATLGMLWLASEWARPAIRPTIIGGNGVEVPYKLSPTPGVIPDVEAGRDIAGAIWLTATKPQSVYAATVAEWSKDAPKLRENNPMLFLVGGKDTAGIAASKFFYKQVLVAEGNRSLMVKPLEQTFLTELKGIKLSGPALLGNDKDTGAETEITKFLTGRQKDRVAVTAKARKWDSPYFINLPAFRVYTPTR